MGAQGGGLLGQEGCEHDACSLALSLHRNKKESSWVRMMCAQQFKGVFSSNLGLHCAPVQTEVTPLFHCATQRRRYEAQTHYKIQIGGEKAVVFFPIVPGIS